MRFSLRAVMGIVVFLSVAAALAAPFVTPRFRREEGVPPPRVVTTPAPPDRLNPRLSPAENRLREAVVVATESYEKARAYKALYEEVGRMRLASLASDEDDSIALQAAWEICREANAREGDLAERGLDPAAAKAFFSAVRLRLGALPGRWRRAILDARVRPGLHTYFANPRLGGCSCTLATPRGAVTASLPIAGFPFDLEAPGWRAEVWSSGRCGLTGLGSHDVELVLAPDRSTVLVFGVESHGAYAEAFDLRTGRCRVRFCTAYWFSFSETWDF